MGLRIKNEKWEYRFRIKGQSVRVSSGLAATERNRKRAEQMEAGHRQAILEGRWGIAPLTPRSFNDAVPEFLKFCDVEYSQHPDSAKRISVSMSSSKVFFREAIISMIGPADINRYKVWRLTDHRVKPVTVKHDLDNLSVFFRWAIEQSYARQNPVAAIKKPSDADAIRQHVVSDAEERRYFANARGNLRDVARLILLQGLRPDEAVRIRKEDVDLDGRTLRVATGKTKAARRALKLTEESLAILAARMTPDGPWVFPSDKKPGHHITKLNCPHDRVCEKTGLSFVLYDFRHTFATRLAQAGVDAFTIAAILGHSSTRVLNRYIHPTQEHQDAAMRLYETSLAAAPMGRA